MLLIFFEPIISFFLKSKIKNANLQKDPVFYWYLQKKNPVFFIGVCSVSHEVPDSGGGMFSFPRSSGFQGWYVQFSMKFLIPELICSVSHEVPDSKGGMVSFPWGSRFQGWYFQFPMRFPIPRVVCSLFSFP